MSINFGGDPTYNPTPQSAGQDRVVDLGNGYSIIYAADGSPGQTVKNIDQTAAGGSAWHGFAPEQLGAANIAAQTAAAQLAQNQSQFQSTQDMNRAINDQQFALSQGGLTGTYGGAPTENRRQFDQGQALAYYKYLSDLASNPRNFVQSFFASRGQVAPAGAQQYGNVNAMQRFNAPQLQIQGQNIGNYQSGLPRGFGPGAPLPPSGGPASPGAPPGFVAPSYADPAAQAGRVSQALGPGVSWASGNLGANGQATSAPTTLGGGTPLVGSQTEDPTYQAFRQNVAQNAMGGNVSQEQAMNPKAVGPNGLAIYKKGGIIPEPVVGQGVRSGKPYMFGEKGPEGVVPANYLPKFLQQRAGQNIPPRGPMPPMPMMGGVPTRSYAVGGVIGDTYSPAPDPYTPPDPYLSSGNMLDPGFQTGTYAGPGGAQAPQSFFQPNTPTNPYEQLSPLPTNTVPTATTGPTTTTTSGVSAYGTPGGYSAPQTTTTPTTSGGGVLQPNNPFPSLANPNITNPTPTGTVTPGVQQPLATPQASNNFNANVAPISGGLTPAQVAPAGTFGAPSGNLPQFLPGEDTGSSTLQSLLQSGALPPFLSRLFAQNKGIQSQGTNTPQQMNLPADVPLVSKLAYGQMTPDEQQALLSYVSSYGVSPETYLALIEQYAPQGQPSQQPNFGNRFAYNPA